MAAIPGTKPPDASPEGGEAQISLSDLLAELDHHTAAIPLPLLKRRVQALALSESDVLTFEHFDPKYYKRNLIHEGPAYTALLLCWKSGQHTAIHNHRGSSCVVRVIRGTVTEVLFKSAASGSIVPAETNRIPSGSVVASYDQDIHLMGNLEAPGEDMVTLHVYSPPLKNMELYPMNLTVFDGHDGIIEAMCKDFPIAKRQK